MAMSLLHTLGTRRLSQAPPPPAPPHTRVMRTEWLAKKVPNGPRRPDTGPGAQTPELPADPARDEQLLAYARHARELL
jgi:hypothetical protein